jgi:hypothetical protein
MLLSHRQNVAQNYDISLVNVCVEYMAQFKYFGATVTNRNWMGRKLRRD